MTHNIISNRCIQISGYTISHNLIEPSKLCDYDYDPNDLSRRFYMSLLHIIHFLDPITNQEVISIKFMSEVADGITQILESMEQNNLADFSEPRLIKDKSLRTGDISNQEVIIAISQLNGEIKFDIITNNNITNISIDKNKLREFIWMIKIEEETCDYDEWDNPSRGNFDYFRRDYDPN